MGIQELANYLRKPFVQFRQSSAIVLVFACAGILQAQQPECENGIVKLASGTNGQITICSAIAAQMPALTRQLADLRSAIGDQKSQMAELSRLVRGLNSVSRNLGLKRQTELLETLSAKLAGSEKPNGAARTNEQITDLADKLDSLQDQLIDVLSDQTTAQRAQAALQGPVGDAIAHLDLTKAESLLADIRKQLAEISAGVGEINERAKSIQKSIEQQRLEPTQLQAALMTADMTVLGLANPKSVSAGSIEGALRRKTEDGTSVALHFLEASADSPEAIAWFKSYLQAGLNANLTVPSTYYDREAVLIEAIRAHNVPVISALLAAGASPHPFQTLEGTAHADARFLFPLQSIVEDSRYSLADKQSLAKAFQEAGMVTPRVMPPGNGWQSVMFSAKRAQEIVHTSLGVSVSESPFLCERADQSVCRRASVRTGEDWCGIIDKMPKRLRWDLKGSTPYVGRVDLVYVLAIGPEEVYFLGLTPPYTQNYVVVRVSKDASNWDVLQFGGYEAGTGACKEEKNFTPRSCWRTVHLLRLAGTNTLAEGRAGQSYLLEKGDCSIPSAH